MKDYSIENSISKIYSEKTKEYFREVSSSYYNSNYRAAIVTLYSVVINDLLIKLEVLDEIYEDTTANAILNEIRSSQEANPKNPDWEKEIVDMVKTRTSLIDNVDYAHIQSLKADRNFCAHPVIDKEDKLYTPNKELVASHIRNMLESLFTKPAVLSKKILSTILIDISQKKDILIDDKSVEKYIKSKYLNNLNQTSEISIFRDLWKFVYALDDEQSEENRFINYKVLYFLFKRNRDACIAKIKSEKEYFNNIRNTKHTVNLLIRFLSENEFLYKEFREDVHLLISRNVQVDPSAMLVAWFLSENYNKHLSHMKDLVKSHFNSVPPFDAEGSAYKRVLQIGISKGFSEQVCDFVLWKYANARQYNEADKTFTYVLKPNLEYFKKEQIVEMCNAANKNSQVTDRNRADSDHKELMKFIENKFPDFSFENYGNLFKNVPNIELS